MKKIIISLLAVLLSLGASAQIQSVKKSEAVKTICTFRTGFNRLCQHGDIYYVTLISSNRYEDDQIVYLGEGKDAAIQTLNDLIDLHSSLETGGFADFDITVEGHKKHYSVIKYDGFNLSFTNFHTAGSIWFAKTEMKTCIKNLQK